MKINMVRSLEVDAIKVIRFARFCDHRGYFTEHFRKSDFANHPEMGFMKGVEFVQCNESRSKPGTLSGRMVDMILDIRKGSPTFGRIICYDMPARPEEDYSEWIWVPPGFAHGNFFTEETLIEYFCSGQYSPGCEAGISPLAEDIDWSLCDGRLAEEFSEIAASTELITDKDRDGFTLEAWQADERSDNFIYGQL